LDNDLQAIVNDKEASKGYNSSTAKAFNAMKQKLKKETKLREIEMDYFKNVTYH
jgi:hypothetical protein